MSSTLLGLVLVALVVSAIVQKDWRWLLAPVIFPLIFVYLVWWTFRPSESSGGQHGHERLRQGGKA